MKNDTTILETEKCAWQHEARTILAVFYPEDTPLRRMLLKHSEQVCDKALAILSRGKNLSSPINFRQVVMGAMLHDIGIGLCHAPGIGCTGTEPYLAHGVLGARMLREYGRAHGVDLEVYARICERHTGSGLTATEIQQQALPIPVRDYLPETREEKLICLADKFFSKSGDMREKTLAQARRSLEKFGAATVARLDALCELFGVTN